MKQSRAQQVGAALAILLVVGATLVGVLLLGSGDGPLVSQQPPTPRLSATPYRLPTVAPEELPGEVAEEPPTDLPTDEPTVEAPTDTPPPTSVPPTDAPTAVPATAIPAVPTALPCRVQAGWVPYLVEIGDTLSAIGRRYGVSASALQLGNCLTSPALQAGDTILVPPRAVAPATAGPTRVAAVPGSPPGQPLPTATRRSSAGACTDSGSFISAPTVGAVLSGVVPFYGTATHPDLQFYKLEVRRQGTDEFVTVYTGQEHVHSGLVGTVNTPGFPNGEYWVRLVVVDSTGNYPERCSILYVFQN